MGTFWRSWSKIVIGNTGLCCRDAIGAIVLSFGRKIVDLIDWNVVGMKPADSSQLQSGMLRERDKIFVPKGKGVVKGCSLLVEKVQELSVFVVPKEGSRPRRAFVKDSPFPGRSSSSSNSSSPVVCVDVGESFLREALGTLKFCLVGKWKVSLDLYPSPEEVEEWVVSDWRTRKSPLANGWVPLTPSSE